MKRNISRKIHAIAGAGALMLILAFLSSTVIAELRGDIASIQAVKQWIVYGLTLLVPAMAAVGASGAILSGKSKATPIRIKQKRMKVVALNGVFVLIPCALLLNGLASTGELGLTFYLVQGVELVAGPINVILLASNFRDGLMLTRT